ncbi:MAG: hypothetical protein HRT57_04960 [Crocinitomicaceae bacterium]|nr:hypothetical protein [Crocinitomicaceae bacterium]
MEAAKKSTSKTKDSKKVEVKMNNINGERRLTVTTTENGETKEEVFEGKAAGAKMKELDSSRKIEKHTKIIKVEKKVIEKSAN